MKSRQTCYSTKDVKTVCPHCHKRAFATKADPPQEYLLCWFCGELIQPLDHSKEWACGDPNAPVPPGHITDLMYHGEEEEIPEFKEIFAAFPSVRFEKEWDEIHHWRTLVQIDSAPKKDYFKIVIRAGLGGISFAVQMTLLDHQDSPWKSALKDALLELKEEKAIQDQGVFNHEGQ